MIWLSVSCRLLFGAPHIGAHLFNSDDGRSAPLFQQRQETAIIEGGDAKGCRRFAGPIKEGVYLGEKRLNRRMQFHKCYSNGTIPILSRPHSHFSHPGLVF